MINGYDRLENAVGEGVANDIKMEITTILSDYAYKKTGRKPIILPVIMDIKK